MLTYNTKVGGYVVDLDKERLQDAPSYSDSESSAWTRTYGKSIDAYYERPDRPRQPQQPQRRLEPLLHPLEFIRTGPTSRSGLGGSGSGRS